MPRGRPKTSPDGVTSPKRKGNNNGATLGFEAQMFQADDKLRKNLEPSDYKHMALGHIFLKHISNAFETKRAALRGKAARIALPTWSAVKPCRSMGVQPTSSSSRMQSVLTRRASDLAWVTNSSGNFDGGVLCLDSQERPQLRRKRRM